jgi:glycosyltransferase involved in cell wall biosynthesis
MNNVKYEFQDLTLLITHYNRSSSLARLLSTFKMQNCHFGDIVVSDDGSKPEHLSQLENLKSEYGFQLIKASVNKGLGNNINKGQDAVKTPYTLYIQEDFLPVEDFASHLQDAYDFMNERKELDIVRFYAYYNYPYLNPYKNGYSEMKIPVIALNYTKIYFYSDHPHLRRSSFFDKFGRYAEGLKGDKTEYKMCISFIQKKGKGLFYNDFKGLFDQVNSEVEPSTMTRSSWTQSRNSLVKIVRDLYRQVKYNLDLKFSK